MVGALRFVVLLGWLSYQLVASRPTDWLLDTVTTEVQVLAQTEAYICMAVHMISYKIFFFFFALHVFDIGTIITLRRSDTRHDCK